MREAILMQLNIHPNTIEDADFEAYLRRVDNTGEANKEMCKISASNSLEPCFDKQNVSIIAEPVEEQPETDQIIRVQEIAIIEDAIETIKYSKDQNDDSTKEIVICQDEDTFNLEVYFKTLQWLCSDHKDLLLDLEVITGSFINYVKANSYIEVTSDILKQSMEDGIGLVEVIHCKFSVGSLPLTNMKVEYLVNSFKRLVTYDKRSNPTRRYLTLFSGWLRSHVTQDSFESSSIECPNLIPEPLNEPPTSEIPMNCADFALHKVFDDTFVFHSAEQINEIMMRHLRKRVDSHILIIMFSLS